MRASIVHLRVRYAETDAQGIVHHSNYLQWFETGRTELLRDAGFPYAELERQGIMMVVARAELKYRQPAFYDDEIRLETRLVRQKGRVVTFGYQVFAEATDTLLVSGETTHMAVGRDRRPVALPAALVRVLAGAEEAQNSG